MCDPIVLRYVVRRLVWMIPTLVGITLVVFVAMHAAPGDPAALRGEASEGAIGGTGDRARFRAQHLLDQPAWKQYFHALGPFNLGPDGHRWFGGSGAEPWHGALSLSFGREFRRPDVEVTSEIARRLAVTVPLSLASIAIAYAIAIPIGVRSARRRGTRGAGSPPSDRALTAVLLAVYSLPTFWCGLLLVLAFGAAGLGWLPVIGLHDKDAASFGPVRYAADVVFHSILPVATLTLGSIAYLSRQTRAAMVETLSQDFIRALRARGIGERTIVWKHALRNSALPLITLFASVFPLAIGGSVIVESIFGLPGMGRYAYEGVLMRDFNVVFATTMLSAVMTLVGILAADVFYALCDPRVRHA